jgi:monoterpene epsilon-lactone hydrolase
MPSLKSRLIIFSVQHSHLLKGRLKRDVITRDTSTVQLRKQFEAGAKKFGAIPPGVIVSPVKIPDLPEGLFAEWIHPASSGNSPSAADKAIFYTHGGGYVTGNCADHRMHVAKFVRASGIGALLYDYRLAPEHPFPAAMQDTLTTYQWMGRVESPILGVYRGVHRRRHPISGSIPPSLGKGESGIGKSLV